MKNGTITAAVRQFADSILNIRDGNENADCAAATLVAIIFLNVSVGETFKSLMTQAREDAKTILGSKFRSGEASRLSFASRCVTYFGESLAREWAAGNFENHTLQATYAEVPKAGKTPPSVGEKLLKAMLEAGEDVVTETYEKYITALADAREKSQKMEAEKQEKMRKLGLVTV